MEKHEFECRDKSVLLAIFGILDYQHSKTRQRINDLFPFEEPYRNKKMSRALDGRSPAVQFGILSI